MNFELLFPGNLTMLQILNQWATGSHWVQAIIYVGAWHADTVILATVVLFYIIRMFAGTRHIPLEDQKARLFDFFKMISGTALVVFVVEILKHAIGTARPFLEQATHIEVLRYYDTFNSFPSEHAAVLLFLGLFTIKRSVSLGIFMLLMTLYVSLSRVSAGVHYPLDVVTGWLIALALYNLLSWRDNVRTKQTNP